MSHKGCAWDGCNSIYSIQGCVKVVSFHNFLKLICHIVLIFCFHALDFWFFCLYKQNQFFYSLLWAVALRYLFPHSHTDIHIYRYLLQKKCFDGPSMSCYRDTFFNLSFIFTCIFLSYASALNAFSISLFLYWHEFHVLAVIYQKRIQTQSSALLEAKLHAQGSLRLSQFKVQTLNFNSC